jgi:hypothetical protein
MRRTKFLIVTAIALTITACKNERSDQASLDVLDNELVGNASDPALTAALEDQIMVDPNLTAKGGRGTRRTPGALAQPIPPERRADAAKAEYAMANGKLLRTPAAGKFTGGGTDGQPVTLGQLASSQKAGAAGGGNPCADKLNYSARWAARLAPEMAVYPQARVVEAAGGNEAPCKMRVVTFRATANMQAVLDYYYTKAVRAGYSAEHLEDGKDHMLGGTRRDDAYMLFLRNLPGGGTEVDLISNVAA